MIDVHGITPLWVAFERYGDEEKRLVTLSWFVEDDPPYRTGRGIRIRGIGRARRFALHFGVMKHTKAKTHAEAIVRRKVEADEEAEAELKKLRPIYDHRGRRRSTIS